MRYLTILMLAVLLIEQSVSAQSNISNPVTIKGIESFETTAKKRHPDLFLPQDEFESDAEYQTRVKKQQGAIAQVKAEFEAKRQTRQEEAERQLQLKIEESRQFVAFAIESIGTYSANEESFPISVQGKSYTLKVPRNEARSFKENVAQVQVQGYKQLQRGLTTWEYFNLTAIHPLSGNRYTFGEQKQITGLSSGDAPISVGKTVVPPALAMRVAFVEPNGNGFLDAGEKGQIKVTLVNSGKGSAVGVSLNLRFDAKDPAVTIENTKFIGEVPAGQSRNATFEINADRNVKRQVNQFTLSATESYGFPPDPVQIAFETYPYIPPIIELVDYGVTTATGDAVIKPGVSAEVQVRVQNRGQGEANKTYFKINLPPGVYFAPESKSEYQFSVLKPGEYKDLVFTLIPSKTVGKEITINIGFNEENIGGALPLILPVEKPLNTVASLIIKGQETSQPEMPDVATVSVDIEKDIPTVKAVRSQDFAVVFGVENYKNVSGVTFAKRDAQWIKTYFEKALGIPAANIYHKTDSDVSLAEFKVAFGGWLQKRIQKGISNVYVFYAGHGAPELKQKKAYLIPYDGNPNYPVESGYELNKLYEDLNALGAKSVTVFLDACFSGANRNNEMLLADARPVMIEIEGVAALGNVTVFSATSGAQIASAWPEKKHGLFSYYLMKGLQGAADSNSDRAVSVKELGDYLKSNVPQTASLLDREQNPEVISSEEQRILVKY